LLSLQDLFEFHSVDLIGICLDFPPSSYALGISSDCWLVFMDRFLTEEVDEDEKKSIAKKMIKLVNLYYWALDGNKVNSNLTLVQFVVLECFEMV
jgi:hypothetical protein